MIQDFPVAVSAEFMIPDQTKVVRAYKSRLRKMQAAQRDINGGYRFKCGCPYCREPVGQDLRAGDFQFPQDLPGESSDRLSCLNNRNDDKEYQAAEVFSQSAGRKSSRL